MSKKLTRKSKFLSLVLRHKPEQIGITLDKEGYVDVHLLLNRWNENHKDGITLKELKTIVDEDEKKRYSFTENFKKIRANQGHSTDHVDISFIQKTPPVTLYHGTTKKSLKDITNSGGLKPMSRQYVHLSQIKETAQNVGDRRKSDTVIIEINTTRMLLEGYEFKVSENGVWLVEEVPCQYFSTIIVSQEN